MVFGKACNLFPGVYTLKIGHVNEHGEPHGEKLCDISFLDFVSLWGCFWGRGLRLDMFVIYFQGCLP